jgi:hypothetical protein
MLKSLPSSPNEFSIPAKPVAVNYLKLLPGNFEILWWVLFQGNAGAKVRGSLHGHRNGLAVLRNLQAPCESKVSCWE